MSCRLRGPQMAGFPTRWGSRGHNGIPGPATRTNLKKRGKRMGIGLLLHQPVHGLDAFPVHQPASSPAPRTGYATIRRRSTAITRTVALVLTHNGYGVGAGGVEAGGAPGGPGIPKMAGNK